MHEKSIPSSSANPDLDWSQVRETVLMLNLAAAQIEQAMRDGDDSVTALAGLFTSMMDNARAISSAAEKLPEGEVKDTVTENYEDISQKMNTAIVAFQFYDKLAQRLAHVCESLSYLGELIGDYHRLYSPREWNGLQELIKSKYNNEEDRKMFQAILDGSSVEEALKCGETGQDKDSEKESEDDNDDHGNVELF
ncbi:hypothetical protein QUF76_09500 [Desulfobacterales bacterium HSG16]|nr:hypothetical protein [Desulfobacterales bacterium HSG16]